MENGCPFFIFHFDQKMENEKWMTIFHFPFALENENNGMYTDPGGGRRAKPSSWKSACRSVAASDGPNQIAIRFSRDVDRVDDSIRYKTLHDSIQVVCDSILIRQT